DLGDVLPLDGGRRATFAQEPLDDGGDGAHLGQEELDGHLPLEVEVPRREDDSHAPLPEHPFDPVLLADGIPRLHRDGHLETKLHEERWALKPRVGPARPGQRRSMTTVRWEISRPGARSLSPHHSSPALLIFAIWPDPCQGRRPCERPPSSSPLPCSPAAR